jgi:hypothetical protein
MALAVPDEPVWLRLVVLASVPVVGYLLDEFESRYRSHGLGMVFFCLAVAGTFLAVPDTELARAMVAVSFPMVFLAWPRTLVSIGRSGGYMAGAVFAMATTAGGVGREASVIGGMACLGFLMLEPLAVRRRPRLVALPASLHRTPEAAVLASVPQAAMVYFASRVAGPLSSIPVALTLVVALFGAGYLMLIWVERNRVPESDDEG